MCVGCHRTTDCEPGRSRMSRRTKVTITVSVGLFMASLDLFIVNIAFPKIERDFPGTSLSTLSWVLNAYAIGYAALLVPAGRWADRAGRKRAFLTGLSVFSLSSAACAAAPSVGVLIAARALQSTGAALMFPTPLGLAAPSTRPEARAAPRSGSGPRSAVSRRPAGLPSAACSCRPAGAGCSSSTSRSGLAALVAGASGLLNERPRARGGAPGTQTRARRLVHGRDRCAHARDRLRARAGAGAAVG